MENEIIDILEDILVLSPDDLKSCETLIDDGYLDSFDIVQLVGELNDAFDINITVAHLVPERFNSVKAITRLINELS